MKKSIFISHSGADSKWVRDFAESLRSQGSEVWLAEARLKPGQPISAAIEKGLRDSDIVAFVVTSPSAIQSNLLFELGAAIAMGKRAVPILAEDVRASDLPFPLRARLALTMESPDKTAAKLLEEAQPEPSAS